MKWNIAIMTLVASLAFCTQAHSFDLLDRMLGGSGCGCASSCCETANNCCDPCADACGCDPCGNTCGVDECCDPCGNSCCRKPLISINLPKIRPLFRRCNSCCDPCGNTCGVDASCGCGVVDNGCGCGVVSNGCGCDPCATKCCRKGLLDMIFGSRCKSSCCDPCGNTCGVDHCGCAGHMHHGNGDSDAASEGEAAILPPTPVVDPNAFVAPRHHVLKVGNR